MSGTISSGRKAGLEVTGRRRGRGWVVGVIVVVLIVVGVAAMAVTGTHGVIHANPGGGPPPVIGPGGP